MGVQTIFTDLPRVNRVAFSIGVAGIVAGALGILLSHDAQWIKFFDNLHWTFGTAFAAVLAWSGWARGNHPLSHKAHKWFFLGFAGYACGQIIWDIQTFLSYHQFPSPSDLFYLWLGPCLTIGLLYEARRQSREINRQAFRLDILSLAVASLTLVLVSYLPKQGSTDALSMAALVAYPVSLIIPVCTLLIMIPALRLRINSGVLLFLPGIFVTAWSWMRWNYMALEGVTIDGDWFNVSFSMSILIAGLGISDWQLEQSDSVRWDRWCEAALRMLPIISIIFASIAMVVVRTVPHFAGLIEQLTYAGSVLVIILAVIRQSHLLRERDLLLAAQREAIKTGDLMQSIINTAPIRVFWKDRDSRYLGCNELFARDAGYDQPEQLIGKTDFELSWKKLAGIYRADDLKVIESGVAKLHYEAPLATVDGRKRWLRTSKVPLRDDQKGEVIGIVGIYEDITDRKQDDDRLRIAATAFELQQGMMVTNANREILSVNKAFTEITGYSAEEAIGKSRQLITGEKYDADFYTNAMASLNSTGSWQGEVWTRHKKGHEFLILLTISAVKNEEGVLTHFVTSYFDITERKEAEKKIKELAFYDQLTGLPNRTLLLDRLKQTVAASSRNGLFGALLLIDLDNFKTLNDTLGHDMGDMLLKLVAQRLTHCARESDTVARLGGDEFVVVLPGVSKDAEAAAAATESVAEKILAAFNQAYLLGELAHYCTASVGVTLFQGGDVTIDDLMKQADLAMYKSKAAGRNSFCFFDPTLESAIKERAALDKDLREAITQKQFLLHYHALMASNQLTGAEVLVRWQHPQRGLVSPLDFIPLAEETGLILALGEWVLETACTQLATWATRPEFAHLTLSVNVSARQFRQPDFVDKVLETLQNTGANPQRLKLELTESLLVSNVEEVVEKMAALKARGVGFSLDDFGTGFSSLSYLKRLPLDQLKIDRSFVRDVLTDPNDASIARTIIALAQSLGLGVIAEGVETAAQRDFLANSGCHAYQGYFFSRPLQLAGFEDFALGCARENGVKTGSIFSTRDL